MKRIKEKIEDYIKRSFSTQGRISIRKLAKEIKAKINEDNGVSKSKVKEILNDLEYKTTYETNFFPSKKQKRLNRIQELRGFLI